MQRFTQGSDGFVGGSTGTTLHAGRHRDTNFQPSESDLLLWDVGGMHSSVFIPGAIAYQRTSNTYYYDYSACNLDHFNVQPRPQLDPYSPFQYRMSPPTYSPTSPANSSQTFVGPVTAFGITGYETFSLSSSRSFAAAAINQTLSTPHRRPTDPFWHLSTSVRNTDQGDLLTSNPVPYTSAKVFRRPAPSGKPDCAPSLQRAIGCVLWSLDFHCEWNECLYSVHRADFLQYEDYLDNVIKHLKRHSGPQRLGWTCEWQGVCQAKIMRSVRDQQRHLRSHLPFYSLCIQCGKFTARPDARGRSDPCRRGVCRPKEGIRHKIEAANRGHDQNQMTLLDFYNAVFN